MVITIGKVVKTVGLKGEIKVYPYTDEVDQRYKVGSIILIDGQAHTIEHMRLQGNCPIIKLNGLTTIEMVQPLVNHEVTIDSEALPKIDGYYGYQLKGYTVRFDGNTIGTITAFEQYGPQLNARLKNDRHTFLVPFNKPFIQSIDETNKTIMMIHLEGLV